MLLFQEPLSHLRHLAHRLGAQVALDPARSQPAAVLPLLSQIMLDALGWAPETQVSIGPSAIPPGTLDAYTIVGGGTPGLIVAALDYLRPHDDGMRVAAAREVGARWLLESNLVEWRLSDTAVGGPGFTCRLEEDNSMRCLLSALTYREGMEQRIEQVATIGRVRSFEHLLLAHLTLTERSLLVDAMLTIAAKEGVVVDPRIAKPVLMEGMLALDPLGAMLKDAPGSQLGSWLDRPDDRHSRGSSMEAEGLASKGRISATSPTRDPLGEVTSTDLKLHGKIGERDEQHPLVYEKRLSWKSSDRRKWMNVGVRAFKLRDLPVVYVLEAGSTVVLRIELGAHRFIDDARRKLESSTTLVPVPEDAPTWLVTSSDVIFHSLGALLAAVVGLRSKATDTIVDPITGEFITVAEIENEAEAEDRAKFVTVGQTPFEWMVG